MPGPGDPRVRMPGRPGPGGPGLRVTACGSRRQRLDQCDATLMIVPDPQAGQATTARRCEVDVADVGLIWQKVVTPLAGVHIEARGAIGVDARRPCVAHVVMMGVVR